ncbi:unnamed protein product [Ectocarpus sp. 13 AM-2016]
MLVLSLFCVLFSLVEEEARGVFWRRRFCLSGITQRGVSVMVRMHAYQQRGSVEAPLLAFARIEATCTCLSVWREGPVGFRLWTERVVMRGEIGGGIGTKETNDRNTEKKKKHFRP